MYSSSVDITPQLKSQILNRVAGALLRRSINSQMHGTEEWRGYEDAISALVKTIDAEQEWGRMRELLMDKWGMD